MLHCTCGGGKTFLYMTLFSQRHGTITSAAICNTFTTHALVSYGTLGVHGVRGGKNESADDGLHPLSRVTSSGGT